VGEPLERDLEAAGLPLSLALVTGDTATGEFDQDDLYTGPFVMSARAASH
jgi:hypothetical protein